MQRRQAAWGGAIVAAAGGGRIAASGQTTERVSIAASGAQAIGGRYVARPAVSGDGTTVAFESPSHQSGAGRHERGRRHLRRRPAAPSRASRGTGARSPTAPRSAPRSRHTGRFVAFDSCASNLVAGDTNSASDVFVLDRSAQTVTRVSVSSAEGAGQRPELLERHQPERPVRRLPEPGHQSGSVGTPPARTCALRDLVNGNTFLVSRAIGVAGALAHLRCPSERRQ